MLNILIIISMCDCFLFFFQVSTSVLSFTFSLYTCVIIHNTTGLDFQITAFLVSSASLQSYQSFTNIWVQLHCRFTCWYGQNDVALCLLQFYANCWIWCSQYKKILLHGALCWTCVCKTISWTLSSCFILRGLICREVVLSGEKTLYFPRNNVDQWFCYVEKGRGCITPPCKTSSMTNCVCLRGQGGKCGFELRLNECSF